MKNIIFISLLVLSLSYIYDANEALEYTNEHCPESDVEYSRSGRPIPIFDNSGAIFVTKCLKAGGFDTSNCMTDDNGNISSTSNLSSCLTQKGWKSSTTLPRKFRAGYPLIIGEYSFMATEVEGENVKYSSHSLLSMCNDHIGSIIGETPLYFYLD